MLSARLGGEARARTYMSILYMGIYYNVTVEQMAQQKQIPTEEVVRLKKEFLEQTT